ncbi:hypothetical protein TRFO_05464 [Tritrichomonas foetus]|uniref:Uncharacterized protein n=1 Tax=Tritrichomonas foetus TaxID=1144522 RepID=A0A1J4K5U5_9EUKA|nr:hypothetical protein TRFO_05464 [Tritrichomonas foetus]|eukprot:OHT06775.1 hypothetical protein TRFO_05464 [Tritrichomonas foetus]
MLIIFLLFFLGSSESNIQLQKLSNEDELDDSNTIKGRKRGSAHPKLSEREKPIDHVLKRYQQEEKAIEFKKRKLPKTIKEFSPIIEIPTQAKKLDMMVDEDKSHPKIHIQYPKYCCRCNFKKNVSSDDPITKVWVTGSTERTIEHESILKRIEKLESKGVKTKQLKKVLKTVEKKTKSDYSSKKHTRSAQSMPKYRKHSKRKDRASHR